MAVNQKDKKEKSKTKKQIQNKESKTLRLMKERKRKAQLRTNPALSIYESGRERTKRVVKKEYPLVNINKLPSILIKGNDNIGVVWKNTNKIQSHTLFATSNLPNREPESKDDYFYLLAPFKEPKSVDIVEELKKYKEKFAKENENRYPDIKSKITKVSSIKSVDTRASQLQRKRMNIDNQNKFDTMDNTYEESIKKNFIPLLSTFSTNPLTKNRFILENGLDKTNKGNTELLHKIKKKINKNKTQSIQNKLSKVNKISDEITLNKSLFNNFGTIMNSIQPLESIISAKPFSVNSFITNQGVNIPTMDFFNDSIDLNKNKREKIVNENLYLNDGNSKINHNNFSFENQVQIEKMNENQCLSNLLIMNENDKNLINNSFNQKNGKKLFLDENFSKTINKFSNKLFIKSPKPKHSGSLDEILAPFKVPVSSPKVKFEKDNLNKKNSFNSFNCFNIDDMDLPKIKLSQDMKLEEDGLFNSNYNIKDEIFKKELEIPLREKKSYGTLGEIAKFSTNISYNNKLKNVKMEDYEMKEKSNFDFSGLDMSKVKKENLMEADWIGNNSSILLMPNLGNNNINPSLLNVNGNTLSGIINTNDNFMNMDNSLMNISDNNLLQNNDVLNPNMAIECYNTELNFLNSPCILPNSLDDVLTSNIKSKEILSSTIPESKLLNNLQCNNIKTSIDNPDINTICDINQKVKDEFVQGCCSDDIPLATTTSSNLRTIPDWYNQNDMDMVDNNSSSSNTQLIKPLAPINDKFLPDIAKEILNDTNQYTTFLDSEIPQIPLPFEETYKIVNESNVIKQDMNKISDKAFKKPEDSLEKKNDELPENIIDEIIDRLANDDQLKDKSDESCFIGCTLQETGKLIKKMSNELKQHDLKLMDQLENSEKKWKEWRKEVISYEDEAHQWLNARIEFYSRRVNEYRKDWIEYWIKRYLMQQKQQIKSLSYYINIPQNLQFATSTSTAPTSILTQTNVSKSSCGESNSNDSSEQCTERTTTNLVAVKADVDRDQRLEVIGRTIDVANKELLNKPTLIEEYHEKLLIEKKILLEKYDIVDSLDLIPSEFIEPISNLDDNNLINLNDSEKSNDMEEDSSVIKESTSTSKKIKVKSISINSSEGGSKGFKSTRKDQEEIACVLIDEYVKTPFKSQRIFIHGIPKDYQLMFNDKMKSLIFILDKCIQDKKDLFHTMEENRKQYFIKNENKK